jgi:hypothetical protein
MDRGSCGSLASLEITEGTAGFPSEIGCGDPRSQKRDLGHPFACYRRSRGVCLSYSSSIWRSKGGDCMQSSWAIFFRAAFKAELGQGSTVTTKGRRSLG